MKGYIRLTIEAPIPADLQEKIEDETADYSSVEWEREIFNAIKKAGLKVDYDEDVDIWFD